MKTPVSLSRQNEFQKIWLLTGQLTLSEPSEHGGEFAITSFPFEVGRRADATCSLSSTEVSNYHAEIFKDEDGIAVRDLGSTNGTYINGKRIEESSLNLGDLLQFADVIFRIQQWEQGSNEKTVQGKNYSQALALMEFDQLMNDRSVVPFFQPIHSIDGAEVIGYEVLAQSLEDFVYVRDGSATQMRQICTVRHEPTRRRKSTPSVHRRKPSLGRELKDSCFMTKGERA